MDYGDLLKFFVAFTLITTLLKLSKDVFTDGCTEQTGRLEKEHAQADLTH